MKFLNVITFFSIMMKLKNHWLGQYFLLIIACQLAFHDCISTLLDEHTPVHKPNHWISNIEKSKRVKKKAMNHYTYLKFRSSLQRCSVKKIVLRNFAKFTGKHLKRLWHRCFPLNFTKFLRTPFSQNPSGRLLPKVLMKKCGRPFKQYCKENHSPFEINKTQ